MSYSRNFGMRSFENVVRDARFRVPATGTPIKIGAPVMLDAANAGLLKPATAAVAPGANTGLAIFEHIQNKSDALVTSSDYPYDEVPLGVYAQMMHGPGVKVWLRNTAAVTLSDGRVRAAQNIIVAADVATLAVGDGLAPDGAGLYKEVATGAWMIIEQINATTGRVEARLTF